jgi:hypothetical protein
MYDVSENVEDETAVPYFEARRPNTEAEFDSIIQSVYTVTLHNYRTR